MADLQACTIKTDDELFYFDLIISAVITEDISR